MTIQLALRRGWMSAAGVLMALALCACGGSGVKLDPGPYVGGFIVDGASDGYLSITVINGQLGGTAQLTHNEQTVTAAISGLVTGTEIVGNIQATNLGFGAFTGNFANGDASGTFNYTDAGEISTTSGTWLAIREEE